MRTYFAFAATGVIATTLLGAVGWILVPAKAGSWVIVIGLPSLLWAFLESTGDTGTEAARAIMRVHRLVIAALALLIAVDVGVDLAIYAGLLLPESELVGRRFSGLLKGALFVLWGNHLPKLMSPWSLEREPFDWQGVHRFVGWAAVFAGLALVVVWSTLPTQAAVRATEVIGGSAVVLALGYKAISVFRYSMRKRHSVLP